MNLKSLLHLQNLPGEEFEQIGKEKSVEPQFGRKKDATEDLVQMEQDEASE